MKQIWMVDDNVVTRNELARLVAEFLNKEAAGVFEVYGKYDNAEIAWMEFDGMNNLQRRDVAAVVVDLYPDRDADKTFMQQIAEMIDYIAKFAKVQPPMAIVLYTYAFQWLSNKSERAKLAEAKKKFDAYSAKLKDQLKSAGISYDQHVVHKPEKEGRDTLPAKAEEIGRKILSAGSAGR
jgi:hypothetical protein